MVKNIFLSILSGAIAAVCIVSAIFRWYIPGYILLGVALLWFAFVVFNYCRKVSLWGLVAVGALIVVFFGTWLPIALTGYDIVTIFECTVIGGAITSIITIPFYFVGK
ncbi:MAG: hypothetical protein J6Y68_01530 [Clostridia bacterium]|nr:hypothetical protein [Clostridia bacterium]MBP5592669.1 hypothetical protein [Clostridia bacterium]MBP5648770.1 hypothetical protein [Clostridia bacterium]